MAGEDRPGLKRAGLETVGGTHGRVVASGEANRSWTADEGRKFGLSVGVAFLILCGLLTWRGHVLVATAAGILGGLLVIAGLVLPSHLEPVHRVWMAGARAISRVTTPLFMGLVYFFVITPSGWLRRTFGSSPLRREETEAGFWVRRDTSRSDLTRQF